MAGGWERLASHTGGTVFALATTRGDAEGTDVFAATAAGLFRATDVTRGWQATGAVPLPLLAAVAPSGSFATNGLLFAGTQTGFFRSHDAGRTWQQTLTGGRVLTIATAPGDGESERVFIGTETDGILHSDDAGLHWTPANPGLLDLTVLALAFSPAVARDRTGFAATASGLYRTRNGGQAWRAVALPRDDAAVQCLALSPAFADDHLLLAGTEADGLWRSDDSGTHWQPVAGVPAAGVSAIAFSQQYHTSRRIAAATSAGVALSEDGGETWRLLGQTLPPVLALAFVPREGGELLVAGLHRAGIAYRDTTTQEDHWVTANTGLGAALLTDLVASPAFARDGTFFATGPEAGIHVSHDGGNTWRDATGALGDAVIHRLTLSLHVTGAYVALATTDRGTYRSEDDGMHWEAVRVENDATPRSPPTAPTTNAPPTLGASLPTTNGETATLIALASGDGLMFAATSAGVYRARPNDRAFAAWNDGLDPVPMLALAVAETDGGAIVFALGIDGTIWRRPAE